MKKISHLVFFTLLILTVSCANAQQYGIVKAHAFYRQTVAGNIPVDENGNPTDNGVRRHHLIYIETSNGKPLPQIQQVFIDGLPYSVQTIEASQNEVNLGKLRGQEKEVIIKKGSGNKLWQLVIAPTENVTNDKPTASIVLSGQWKNKSFTYKITKVQQLARINYP